VCRARLSFGPRKMKDWKFLMVLQSKTRCEFFKALSSLRQKFDIELRILYRALGIKKKSKAEVHPSGVIYSHSRGYISFQGGFLHFIKVLLFTMRVHKVSAGLSQPLIVHLSCLILSIGLFHHKG
jgi:hypothetical protein